MDKNRIKLTFPSQYRATFSKSALIAAVQLLKDENILIDNERAVLDYLYKNTKVVVHDSALYFSVLYDSPDGQQLAVQEATYVLRMLNNAPVWKSLPMVLANLIKKTSFVK